MKYFGFLQKGGAILWYIVVDSRQTLLYSYDSRINFSIGVNGSKIEAINNNAGQPRYILFGECPM